MDNIVGYTPTERKVIVGSKEVTVRSLTPVFKAPEEHEHASQQVRDGLYQIFRKYMDENVS